MTDHHYLVKMLDLITKLTNACDNEGFGSDAYNAVRYDIAEFAEKFLRSRRRRAWYRLISLCILACVLAWAFYKCLRWLGI